MDIPVLRIAQSQKTLYLGSITVADLLLDNFIIDSWDPGKIDLEDQGYQRELHADHVKSIETWLKSDPMPFMPNGALLSARESEQGVLAFTEIAAIDDVRFGTLHIPSGREIFIVDYQHRWNGLRRAVGAGRKDLLNWRIPVTILVDATRKEEMIQFFLINSKQKRIDTDLALAIIRTLSDASNESELVALVGRNLKYRIRAVALTYELALRRKGPWAGKIELPHDVPTKAVLKTKSFADSLQPLLSSRSPVSGLSDKRLLGALENYWTAIGNLMPEAFDDPRSFSIQKTPGVFSMHIVAAKTVLRLCSLKSDYGAESIQAFLDAANSKTAGDETKYLASEFWRARGDVKQYSSSGAHRTLATLIRQKIEAAYPLP